MPHGIGKAGSDQETGGADASSPAPIPGGVENALPPLSNRGVDAYVYQTNRADTTVLDPNSVFRSRFDFLTVSMSTRAAESLLDRTEHLRNGGRVMGFGETEERMCFGGTMWVRSDPNQASRKWGTDYVSIELPGSQADAMLEHVPAEDSRATRIDLAHDWECEPDLIPEHLRDAWRQYWEPKGITSGISGENGINTVYLGARSSDKRIRVYRKDRQDAMWAEYPLIRVETVVRREVAAAVWSLSTRAAMGSAMNHALKSLTGFDMGDCVPPPPVPDLRDTDLGQRVFEFIRQNSRLLLTLDRLGIDLSDYLSLAEGELSRRTEQRLDADLLQYAGINADDLYEHVRRMLRG